MQLCKAYQGNVDYFNDPEIQGLNSREKARQSMSATQVSKKVTVLHYNAQSVVRCTEASIISAFIHTRSFKFQV